MYRLLNYELIRYWNYELVTMVLYCALVSYRSANSLCDIILCETHDSCVCHTFAL